MQADKEKVCRLLKTARGQIDGVLRMIEEDRYCIEISRQVMAAEAVLRRANSEILQAHLAGCVKSAFESGSEEEKDEKIREVMDILEKLSK